jgi:S1-C subfamily serine protease
MASERLAGAVLRNIDAGNPLAGRIQGVEIATVEHGSPAWAAGLRPGDVIVAVNRQPVASVGEVTSALGAVRDGLLLHVRRGEGTLFVFLR